MRIKVLSTFFAAMVVAMSLSTLHMANVAYSSLSSSPIQPNSKQDAMNNTITAGLQLANQSSKIWQEKLHGDQSDQKEQSITANGLNSHNDKLDNNSPSVLAQLPFGSNLELVTVWADYMVGVNWICDSDVDNQNKWTATNQGKKWIEKFPQGQLGIGIQQGSVYIWIFPNFLPNLMENTAPLANHSSSLASTKAPNGNKSSLPPIFVLCDTCYWCATYFSNRRLPTDSNCPQCNANSNELTSFPIASNESFTVNYNKKRGIEFEFKPRSKRSKL